MRALIAALTTAALLAPGTVAAEWPYDDPMLNEAYDENRICFAPLDGDTTRLIAVVDTWELATWDTLNVGSTSQGPMPCVPTDCPAPFTLISGGCSATDPFAHVPVQPAVSADPPAHDSASVEVIEPIRFSIDVGPLVEPPVVGVTP